jgi:hypothetical protein
MNEVFVIYRCKALWKVCTSWALAQALIKDDIMNNYAFASNDYKIMQEELVKEI